MIITTMIIIIKMTTLSTYYQWNGIQISNKKKLEAMSSQVKWKAAAAVERSTEVGVDRGRTETVLESRAVLLRTWESVHCLLPLDVTESHCSGPAQSLPRKKLPLAPFIICDSDPDKFALDLPSLAETLKGGGSQRLGAIQSFPLTNIPLT